MNASASAERKEISVQEVKFFTALKVSEPWLTIKELAKAAQICDWSAKAYALKFVRLGIADVAEVLPAHRYKLSRRARKRNNDYLRRLNRAREVFSEFLVFDLVESPRAKHHPGYQLNLRRL